MDSIKEAFQKVKKDMDLLTHEISSLRLNIDEIKQLLDKDKGKYLDFKKKSISYIPTNRQINSTHTTLSSTQNVAFNPLKGQNLAISTGNRGVPTDKQTNRQTNRHMQNDGIKEENTIENAVEILNSLDNIKKEIRLKFKRLTEQEILVFSQLYQLDEEVGYSDYKTLSKRLNLSESSIRDYIGRLIKKGIPVEKHKIKNKNVQLSISENLKKIATLSTILRLREL